METTHEEETQDKISSISTTENTDNKEKDEDENLHSLLIPDPTILPPVPPSAVDSNFARYYAAGTSYTPIHTNNYKISPPNW